MSAQLIRSGFERVSRSQGPIIEQHEQCLARQIVMFLVRPVHAPQRVRSVEHQLDLFLREVVCV